jgi:hypothetical protein
MVCTEDPARGDILPAMDHAPFVHGQAPVVTRAHSTNLAMNAHLLPLKACSLTRSEASIADSISNASLLVELALHNRILRLFLRSGLDECHGRRCKQGRHKYELCESHGVSPSVTAVTLKSFLATHTSRNTKSANSLCKDLLRSD